MSKALKVSLPLALHVPGEDHSVRVETNGPDGWFIDADAMSSGRCLAISNEEATILYVLLGDALKQRKLPRTVDCGD